MGRKKEKKVSPKKERYSKFRKDKPSQLDISMPDLDDEATKLRREDDTKVEKFFKYSRKKPRHEIVRRREVSKRDRTGR